MNFESCQIVFQKAYTSSYSLVRNTFLTLANGFFGGKIPLGFGASDQS